MNTLSQSSNLPIFENCVAIDGTGTFYKEDCMHLQKERHGYTLRIMAVIPNHKQVNTEAILVALREQLKESSQSSQIPIFAPKEKNLASLSLRHLRYVLIVEYRFNDKYRFISESVYIGKARLEKIISFDDFIKTSGMNIYFELICEAIKAKKELFETLKHHRYLSSLRMNRDLGSEIVFNALELFNNSLRTFARINKIPFVSPPHKKRKWGFKISGGYARFNNGLRNPCSFINIINLVFHLKHKQLFLNESELDKILPKRP